jgi:hypothetical protein
MANGFDALRMTAPVDLYHELRSDLLGMTQEVSQPLTPPWELAFPNKATTPFHYNITLLPYAPKLGRT